MTNPDHDTGIYSRVTVIDHATIYVTASRGDFPATVLEELVTEHHIPSYTHNPPTVIVLESDLGARGEGQDTLEPTPLVRAVNAALFAEIDRLEALESDAEPARG